LNLTFSVGKLATICGSRRQVNDQSLDFVF
jgi:hypothetical protein